MSGSEGGPVKLTLLLPNIEISGGNRANFESQTHRTRRAWGRLLSAGVRRDGLGWLNLRKSIVQWSKGFETHSPP